MSLRDDLVAARALIDTPEKWRKDSYSGDQTTCCAVIAANRAHHPGDSTLHYPTAHRLAEALPEAWLAKNLDTFLKKYGETIGRAPGFYVGAFNDDPTTTHNDVLALFDRAIEAATPQEGVSRD